MNGLAFEHYVDKPWAIFQGWHAALFHEKLTEGVTEAFQARRPLNLVVRSRLRWYPALLSDFIISGQVSRPDIEAILDQPAPRFYALVNHYAELAPLLETNLLGDPESAERLIRWIRYRDKVPFREQEEYIRHIGDDPNRHYRLTPPADRPGREKMFELAGSKKLSSPAWAYLFVSCDSFAKLDADMIKVLHGSEEYSYLTALVMRKRGLKVEAWQPLLEGIKSHRWAFHAMRDLEPGSNIDATVRSRLLHIVHSSPPWAVQLWESRGWHGEQLFWAHKECLRYSEGHECLPELSAWYRMAKQISGKTTVAIPAL